jgi:hypothetical protein
VVEGARLESVYTLTRIEGSNPSLSANLERAPNGVLSKLYLGGFEPEIIIINRFDQPRSGAEQQCDSTAGPEGERPQGE